LGTDAAFFEELVLSGLIASQRFFDKHASSLRGYAKLMKGRGRFSTKEANLLFDLVCLCRESNSRDGLGEEPIPRGMIKEFVSATEKNGELVSSMKERLLGLIDRVYANAKQDQAKAISEGLFIEWFRFDLLKKLADSDSHDVSTEEAKSRFDALMALGRVQESAVVSYEDAMEEEVEQTEHMASGLFDLDKALGGGFRKGESTLVAGVTGGGKTVMATQFAAQFALDGHKVLFVTTEERPGDLIPRMLSNHLNVPYGEFQKNLFNDTVIPSHILENARLTDALDDLNSRFGENLIFFDWAEGQGKSVEENLARDFDKLTEDAENPFAPDVLIFDWIGGALYRKSKEDLRFLYLAAANHLHDFAKTRDVCTIMFAQLNKRQATGFRCDSGMLAECKAMADQATNAFYVSSKRTDVGGCEDGASYEEIQTINVDKARKGPGGCFRVRRDFRYQRFRQLNSSTLQTENASVNSNNLLGQ